MRYSDSTVGQVYKHFENKTVGQNATKLKYFFKFIIKK